MQQILQILLEGYAVWLATFELKPRRGCRAVISHGIQVLPSGSLKGAPARYERRLISSAPAWAIVLAWSFMSFTVI